MIGKKHNEFKYTVLHPLYSHYDAANWETSSFQPFSYSTEVFFMSDGQYIVEQTNWLKADLKQANDNRGRRPWVIALGHHPQYCSNSPGDDCTKSDSKVRAGQVHVHQIYINIEYLLSIRLQNKPLLTQLLIPAVRKNSIDNRLLVTVTNLLDKSSNLRILKNNT